MDGWRKGGFDGDERNESKEGIGGLTIAGKVIVLVVKWIACKPTPRLMKAPEG
jgi:hypothetical protein